MTAVLCRELGIETESCPFPEYAEKLVQESAFDLVFTDIQMPGVDGFEVLRRIRAVRAELPVVAVSARSDDESAYVERGFAAVLRKPFARAELVAVLRRIVPEAGVAPEECLPEEDAVYYDVSWCMNVGEKIDPEYEKWFQIVYDAREDARQFIQARLDAGEKVRGYEVDRRLKERFEQLGCAQYLMHRTGHNIGHRCHGIGANLDDYETHDDRCLLPGTMFSIEPGLYTDKYGVRLEYDVHITSEGETKVYGPVQDEILVI